MTVHVESEKDLIVDLRTKLEMRTLFLRASVALNIAMLGAFFGFVLNKLF